MDARKQGIVAGAFVGLAAAAQTVSVAAQDDEGIAAAGNGGVATSSANGGAVSVGDILSGGNGGSVIGVGDVYDGAVAVQGSDVSSSTALDISANGGVGVADASGGDNAFAVTLEDDGLVFVS